MRLGPNVSQPTLDSGIRPNVGDHMHLGQNVSQPTLDSGINIGLHFWTFSRGYVPYYRFGIKMVMHIFFQNIRYLMLWGMPILRAMLNVLAKCSRGYVCFRGYF